MMPDDTKKFWKTVAPMLRKKMQLEPIGEDDLKRLIEMANEHHLPKQKVEAFLQAAAENKDFRRESTLETTYDWLDPTSTEAIENEVMALNRNAGDTDAETDDLLNELRKKALNEESDKAEQDDDDRDAGKGTSPKKDR